MVLVKKKTGREDSTLVDQRLMCVSDSVTQLSCLYLDVIQIVGLHSSSNTIPDVAGVLQLGPHLNLSAYQLLGVKESSGPKEED